MSVADLCDILVSFVIFGMKPSDRIFSMKLSMMIIVRHIHVLMNLQASYAHGVIYIMCCHTLLGALKYMQCINN